MKYILFSLTFFVSLHMAQSQNYTKEEMASIQGFLEKFQGAAEAKDSALLEQLIAPSSVTGEDLRAITIQEVLKSDESNTGDFSFSLKAFDLIVDSLYVKFTPISPDLQNMLKKQSEFAILNELTPSQIPLFDYKDAHIILIWQDKDIKLLFWEGMNKLLH